MKKLSDLSLKEIVEMLNTRTTTEMIVDRVVLGFENIEKVFRGRRLDTYFTIPLLLPFDTNIEKLFAYSPNDTKGIWMNIEAITYASDGTVYYKANDKNTFYVNLYFEQNN